MTLTAKMNSLPMITNIFHYLLNTISHWGAYGVFVNMFLENIAVPIPTEPGYIVATNLVREDRFSWLGIGLVILFGQMLGAIVSYYIGKFGYTNLKIHNYKSFIKAHNTLQKWYEKWGDRIIFFARVVGYIRPWSSLVTGLAGADFIIFIRYTFWGTIIHVILSLLATHYLVEIWIKNPGLHLLIYLIILLSLVGGLIYTTINKRKK